MGLRSTANVLDGSTTKLGALLGTTVVAPACLDAAFKSLAVDPTGNFAASIVVAGTIFTCTQAVAASALGTRLDDAVKRARLDPRQKEVNQDLERLIGKAVAHVLAECAREDTAHKKWYKRLANQAETQWLTICANAALKDAHESNLPEHFARATNDHEVPVELLTPLHWVCVLDAFCKHTGTDTVEAARDFAAKRLHVGMFGAIREMVKRDYQGDGRAFVGLMIDLSSHILKGVEDIAEKLDENREDHRNVFTLLGDIPDELAARVESIVQDAGVERRAELDALHNAFLLQLRGTEKTLARIEKKIDDLHRKADQSLKEHKTTQDQVGDLQADMQKVLAALADKQPLVDMHEVLAVLADKQTSADDKAKPPPYPPEVLKAAARLKKRGDKEERLVGAVAEGDDDTALALLEELRSEVEEQRNASDAEAFRLHTLEGDLWYGKGEFDRAIGPYEKARELKPKDFIVNNNLAISLIKARLDDLTEKKNRAIDLLCKNIVFADRGSREWIVTKTWLGIASWSMPVGDKTTNCQLAIEHLEQALAASSPNCYPEEWAVVQQSLGNVWQVLPTGDRHEHLDKAICHYQQALKVFRGFKV